MQMQYLIKADKFRAKNIMAKAMSNKFLNLLVTPSSSLEDTLMRCRRFCERGEMRGDTNDSARSSSSNPHSSPSPSSPSSLSPSFPTPHPHPHLPRRPTPKARCVVNIYTARSFRQTARGFRQTARSFCLCFRCIEFVSSVFLLSFCCLSLITSEFLISCCLFVLCLPSVLFFPVVSVRPICGLSAPFLLSIYCVSTVCLRFVCGLSALSLRSVCLYLLFLCFLSAIYLLGLLLLPSVCYLSAFSLTSVYCFFAGSVRSAC
jgi:hypothetical protein